MRSKDEQKDQGKELMKVLLIEPPVGHFDIATNIFFMLPPYHLEVLAGRLVGNHDVHILDMRIDEDLLTEILGFKPDVVGCSCVAANSRLVKEVLRKVKEAAPETITVVGGHHPSLMPQDCNEPFIDAVVTGEGEETLYEFVGALRIEASLGRNRGACIQNPRRGTPDQSGP